MILNPYRVTIMLTEFSLRNYVKLRSNNVDTLANETPLDSLKLKSSMVSMLFLLYGGCSPVIGFIASLIVYSTRSIMGSREILVFSIDCPTN